MSGLTMNEQSTFHHEALFYTDQDEFLRGTVPFIREGLEAGEPALVMVRRERTASLEAELNGAEEFVDFVDMETLGRNPARIIPAWRDFIGENALRGKRVRGISESIWPDRSAEELVECEHHESLVNLAFANAPSWRLMCPYDVRDLDDAVIEEAHRNHPCLLEDGEARASASYTAPTAGPLTDSLSSPPEYSSRLEFGSKGFGEARAFASAFGRGQGMSHSRVGDLALVVTELATNSVSYGDGGGSVELWSGGDSVVCEVRDSGRIFDPLVGRQRPTPTQPRGRGLWIVNQLCDLVQIRSEAEGTTVRIRMAVNAGSLPPRPWHDTSTS